MKPARYLLLGFLFLGAVPLDAQEGKQAEVKRVAEPLYPIQRGSRWFYRVTDLKAPKNPEVPMKPQYVVVTAESEQIFNIKKKEGSQDFVGFSLQVFGNGKTLQEQVLVADDGVYRVSGAGKTINPPLRILKKGAGKGDTWTCDSQSENAQLKGEFVADVEVVQVPAGAYKALVVRSRGFQVGPQKMQVDYWFSANVGMVKQRVQVGNHDVILELEKYEPAR